MSSHVLHTILEAKEKSHTNIYLNYQNLTELPAELLTLSKAKKLFLKRNILKRLPSDIWKLSNLVELYLHSNNLQELPRGISGLDNLQSLDVSGNQLHTLTPAVGQLTCLASLRLGNNELNHLPTEIGNLQQLKVLDVMNNHLKQLPWQLSQCLSLETLAFDGNEVHHIPRELVKLHNLVEFSASRNKLMNLPHDLDGLTSLQSLLLDGNTAIRSIPATVFKMRNLQLLGVNGCNATRESGIEDQDTANVLHEPRPSNCVSTLLELSLRTSHGLVNSKRLLREDIRLPVDLHKLLASPLGHCYACATPYFTGSFSLITDAVTAVHVSHSMNNAGLYESLASNGCSNITFIFHCCCWKCIAQVQASAL